MTKIKLGLCLKSLGMPFRRSLMEAQKLGVTGIEIDAVGDLAPAQLSQTGRRELRNLLRSHNLELTALGCPLRQGLAVPDNQEMRIDHIRAVMTLAFDLGPRLVIVHPGPIFTDDQDPRSQWLKDALLALSQYGDRVGTTLALETGLDPGLIVRDFLARFDSGGLGVNFNPGNLVMHHHNPYEAARLLQKSIVHAHAKDARSSRADRLAQEVPLGTGDIDWLQLLGLFVEMEFTGWWNVENDAARGLNFLRRIT